jgi:hypothetical protein
LIGSTPDVTKAKGAASRRGLLSKGHIRTFNVKMRYFP